MNLHSSVIRLIAVLAAVVLFLVPLYLFAIRDDESAARGIEAARLIDTPQTDADVSVGVAEGKLAPDFEISTPSGERVRLSDLRGRAVLINFWARWCGSCLSEMPEIKALQEDRGEDAFTVLAINAGETPSQALEFIDFLDAPFVYGLDIDLRVSDAFDVRGLPLSVFIDSEGIIRAIYRGHANRERLAAFTDAAITASPPGEFPVVLRLISTIPRERELVVTLESEGKVHYSSRSLRCDPSYCSQEAVDDLARVPGVLSFKLDVAARPEPALEVTFDPELTSAETITTRLAGNLRLMGDELYKADLKVTYAPVLGPN
ncbi:MAG: TlpA family protein disulfide reductase [Thermomicrobiales bacterium]